MCSYFSEDERFFVVDRVDAVAGDHLRAELAAHGVRRKSEHVHLHVRSQLPVRQKLPGNNLQSKEVGAAFLYVPVAYTSHNSTVSRKVRRAIKKKRNMSPSSRL